MSVEQFRDEILRYIETNNEQGSINVVMLTSFMKSLISDGN